MKILFSLMISSLFSLSSAYCQEQIALWQGDIPYNKKGVSVEEINDNDRITKVSIPMLYRYKASEASPTAKAAIIIAPGGAYIREAIDHEGWLAAKWFAEHGIEAFVLKYRLPDEELSINSHLVPLMDAQQAIALVRSKAKDFNIDPHKIGIIGFSAGGHLAASASTLFINPVSKEQTAENVRPDFSILLYPVISMDDQFTHKGSKENLLGKNPSTEMVNQFSLENQVTEQTPVTLVVHAIDDNAVPIRNSDLYAENLFKKGGDITKVTLPSGGHGFGFKINSPVGYWTEYLEVWLKTKKLSK